MTFSFDAYPAMHYISFTNREELDTMIAKLSDGTYPARTGLGCYPVAYLMGDGACICAACANGENGSEASEDSDDSQWRIDGQFEHLEGEPITCAHCGTEIESAYGVPDNA